MSAQQVPNTIHLHESLEDIKKVLSAALLHKFADNVHLMGRRMQDYNSNTNPIYTGVWCAAIHNVAV